MDYSNVLMNDYCADADKVWTDAEEVKSTMLEVFDSVSVQIRGKEKDQVASLLFGNSKNTDACFKLGSRFSNTHLVTFSMLYFFKELPPNGFLELGELVGQKSEDMIVEFKKKSFDYITKAEIAQIIVDRLAFLWVKNNNENNGFSSLPFDWQFSILFDDSILFGLTEYNKKVGYEIQNEIKDLNL